MTKILVCILLKRITLNPLNLHHIYGLKFCREMVVVWFGSYMYSVNPKCSLAAHKAMFVVPILAQEHQIYHREPYTNYIGRTW